MASTRRTFLQQLGAASLVSIGSLPPRVFCRAAWAAQGRPAPPDGRVLVIIQMEGGNDGLNTVIPFGDDQYYKARPGIGIPRGSTLRLDDYHALHPQMGGMKELYEQGHLAIVQGVGYPHPNRSHFHSMDIWHSAQPEAAAPDRGWIGRALDQVAETNREASPQGSGPPLAALALGQQRLPLALVAASVNVPTVSDLDGYKLQPPSGREAVPDAWPGRLERLARQGNQADAQLHFLEQTAQMAYQSAARLHEVTRAYRPATSYPETGLAQKLKLVAQMVAGELETRIFFVSLGGFDTHAQQPGAHQALLGELSGALHAFWLDLQAHALEDRVVVATFSEFGRRVEENGSMGTDHGAASQMFILRRAHGGLYGPHPSLTDLDQGDLKHHTDFRAVYATLLEKWMGLPSQPVLGGSFDLLDFV